MPYWIKGALFCFLLLVGMGLLSGCATLADARMAKGTGPYRVYDVPADKVWSAMPDVIRNVGLSYVGENRQEGYVLAQRGITLWSYGENVSIFITSLEAQKIRVEIVSKKSLETNIFAPNWADKLFKALDSLFLSTASSK